MIRNYTSQTPVSTSVNRIEALLIAGGARSILREYDPDGQLDGIAFQLPTGEGMVVPIRLPARRSQIEILLKAEVRRPSKDTDSRIRDQAARTAWKLMGEWVQINLDLIKLRQIKPLEAFLPYIYDHGKRQTFFEAMEERKFQGIGVLVLEGGAK